MRVDDNQQNMLAFDNMQTGYKEPWNGTTMPA